MPPTVERATSDLRRLIVGGMLRPGEKISESSAAQLLGLSRTPARFALSQLESEGLIEKRAGRGYTVREIRPEDLEKAIEVRGTLEGLAAARLAAQGASKETLDILRDSVATSEAAVSPAQITLKDVGLYQEANVVFHETILSHCGNEFIAQCFERIKHIPIVTPGHFALNEDKMDKERIRVTVGHSQHVIVLDAIEAGEPLRAEMMMREHAHATFRYAKLFVGEDEQPGLPAIVRAVA